MIQINIKIDRSIDIVWDYFTNPTNWSKWYGGGLKEVVPGWQKGGNLFWALGGSSPISNIIPFVEICISGGWMDTTYKFNKIGNNATDIEIVESDPKGGAKFNDGGAANKAQWGKTIRKLKACIESETIGIKTVDGKGETIEQAYAMAELEISKNSTIIEKKVISEPIEKTVDIELQDDQTVEEKFKLNWGNYILKKAILKNEGKKGFLGIGKKQKEYTITFIIPGNVQIEFQDNPLFKLDTNVQLENKKEKSFTTNEIVDELIRLYDSSPKGEGFYKDSQEAIPVRTVGETLYNSGGMELMLQVHAMFSSKRYNFARNLEIVWGGIGSWQS